MANSNGNAVTVTWPTAASNVTLNTNNRVTSEARSINADAVRGALRVGAAMGTSPVAGDYVDFWIAWNAIATSGSAYDTEEHAQYLGRVNLVPPEDPGEKPVAKTFDMSVSGKQSFKVIAKANQGASRSVTVETAYNEHRMG